MGHVSITARNMGNAVCFFVFCFCFLNQLKDVIHISYSCNSIHPFTVYMVFKSIYIHERCLESIQPQNHFCYIDNGRNFSRQPSYVCLCNHYQIFSLPPPSKESSYAFTFTSHLYQSTNSQATINLVFVYRFVYSEYVDEIMQMKS